LVLKEKNKTQKIWLVANPKIIACFLSLLAIYLTLTIIKKMTFQSTYYNRETTKEIGIASSIVGILLYVLLIIYQPFGTNQFEHSHRYLILFPYAIICGLSFYSINLLVHKNRKWTIDSELFKTLLILLLISSSSYLYNTLVISKVTFSFENYAYMFFYTSAMVIPLATIYILARYIYINNKIKVSVSIILPKNEFGIETEKYIETNVNNSKLYIVSKYSSQNIEIAQEDFVYAEAADNYCILYFYKNEVLQKKMIRISLTELLKQIQTAVIQKVHRSFIVNLKKVITYKGNSSGYKISLDNVERRITISRSYLDKVLPVLKDLDIHP